MPGVRDPALLRALAAEIKARRAELKISQEELAHRAELGAIFIARLEIARNQPSLSAFLQVARGLGVPPPELLSSVMDRYSVEDRSR